ncbi:MAG TPA: hypothetical protein DCZ04_10515 [Syntrophorhabdus aromaticivorans]|nr:hypothetical protein [Syntrophorhabdus aromaticivorans]
MEKKEKALLDTTQAAAYLGLAKSTLDCWRYRGQGPQYQKIGKSVRYLRETLDEYVGSCTRSSTSE